MRRARLLEQRLEKIRERHSKPKYKVIDFPNLVGYQPKHSLSDKIDGLCPKTDKTTDFRWKKGRQETAATIKEIETKKKRIRPKFGKGAYDYATDGDNSGPIRIYAKGG